MKEEIRRILEMVKAGTLTDEQATALLAELSSPPRRDDAERSSRRTARRSDGVIEPLFSLLRNTVSGAMDAMSSGLGATSSLGGVFASDLKDNAVHMSRCDSPNGSDYVFKGNSVRMSSVTDVSLDHAEMKDNRFDASKIESLKISQGEMSDCDVVASAFDHVVIDSGHLVGSEVSSSKCTRLTLCGDSTWEQVRLRGGAFKEIVVGAGSHWRDLSVAGAHVGGLASNASLLEDVELQGVHLTDITFDRTEWRNVLARAIRMARTTFVDCAFDDVLLAAGEAWSWKKCGFEDVRMEACKLNKVLFSDCRFVRVVIRNVDITDLKLKGVELTDATLDGNEAFLAAVHEQAPRRSPPSGVEPHA